MSVLKLSSLNYLKSNLDDLSNKSSTKELLDIILSWMRSNKRILEYEPFNNYLLLEYLEYDYSLYPIEYSSMHGDEVDVFKRIINSYTTKSEESLAMLLSGTLEKIITLEVDDICYICGGGLGMSVWYDELASQVVLDCNACHNTYNLDGSLHKVLSRLKPATLAQLKEVNLIK